MTHGPYQLVQFTNLSISIRFKAKWKSSPHVVVEIIEYERPHRWAGHNAGPLEVTVRCRLEPVSEGTKLFADFEANASRLVQADLPAVSPPDHARRSGKT